MKKRVYWFFAILLSLLFLSVGCGQADCEHTELSETTIEPTCSQEGYILHRCLDCSFQYKTDLTAPRGHQLSATRFDPTCAKEGYTHYACPCGYQFQSDFVTPIGHTYTQEVIVPDCTTGGYTNNTCTVCEATYVSDETPPRGHTFSETVVPPTCTEYGYTQKDCETCDFTYIADYRDPVGHTLSKKTVPPTCEEEGYVEQSCSVCHISFISELFLPTGHTFSDFRVIHPTRTRSGSITGACACGYERMEHLYYSDVFTGAYVTENTSPLAKGVDVSKWQHNVNQSGTCDPLDWNAIRAAGFDFAILKAGSSRSGKDPVFEMNYRDAKAAGMELGVYFYSYAATIEEIRSDALTLITWLADKQLEYPVYFDLEDPSQTTLGKDTLTEFCVEFITILQQNGYYGALYSNNDWLTNYLHGDTLKAVYDVWYARYPSTNENPTSSAPSWNTEKYGPQLGMWQYTDQGVIEGFDRVYFDFNYAYRDYTATIKQYGYNGYSIQDFPTI